MVALAGFAAVSQGSDVFYTSLLTRGIANAQRGDYFRAAKELRLAAFGTVDDPKQYLRAQVYLANALEHLGLHADAAAAVEKASRAERISNSYANAPIDSDTRTAFEGLAAKWLRPEQLALVPSFSQIVAVRTPPPAPVPQQPIPPPAPAPAPTVTVVSAPKPVAPPVAATAAPVKPQPKPPAPSSPVGPQTPASPLVAASRHQPSQAATLDATTQILDAQRLLNEGKIIAARQIYFRLAQTEGLGRVTMLDVAKGLNQTSAWRESSASYQKLSPFRQGEEIHQFYEAVNRYELGDVDGARDLMTRALPALPVTRETSLYRTKILGMQ